MKALKKELAATINAWPVVSKVIAQLHTEAQYKKAVKTLDILIDEVSQSENPTIESLIETLGTLIKDYEDRHVPEPVGDPIGCLKLLMEEHRLKPTDLTELGSQRLAQRILNGKRQLTVPQIQALSRRFFVSPAVFVQQ